MMRLPTVISAFVFVFLLLLCAFVIGRYAWMNWLPGSLERRKAARSALRQTLPGVEEEVSSTPGEPVPFCFPRIPVLWMLLFGLLTLGIYPAVWFIRRHQAFNAAGLGPLSLVRPYVMLGVAILMITLGSLSDPPVAARLCLDLLTLLYVTLKISMALILRQRLESVSPGTSTPMTFFFTIYYVQARINRLPKQSLPFLSASPQ